MKRIKLFLTDQYFRWATLELLKLKIQAILGLDYILSFFKAKNIINKTQGMGNWEQYTEIKSAEYNSRKNCFKMVLIQFQAVTMSGNFNKEMFMQAKNKVLSFEDIINEPELKEFKEWLEEINYDEKDYTQLQKVISSFEIAK